MNYFDYVRVWGGTTAHFPLNVKKELEVVSVHEYAFDE